MSTYFMVKKEVGDLITQAEAARLRGVTRAAISKLVGKGKLKAERIAGNVLVYRKEVLSFTPAPSGRPRKKANK